MSTAAKLLVATACAGLVGCQTGPTAPPGPLNFSPNMPPKPAKIRECKTGNEDRCEVVVTVNFDQDSRPYLLVDNDSLFKLVKKNKKPTITWVLKVVPENSPRAGDFEFDTSTRTPGINFGTDVATQIKCYPPVQTTAKCDVLGLQNTELSAYKYAVNVVDKTKANAVYPLDPWVVAE